MKHISLFSGIGGFDLAAEWMRWENIAHCEYNPFGQRILKYYWPKAISYEDITKTDFTIHRGNIDIVTGGFPCQPYSVAGKRKGKEDDRHLWPEMLRAIREIQPRWVVGENVRGLTNWNGGLVFDEVQADLEALGYEITPFLLPACGVDAPHRRDRIWFVAYSNHKGGSERFGKISKRKRDAANAASGGLERPWDSGLCEKEGESKPEGSWPKRFASETNSIGWKTNTSSNWKNFPTQPPVCNGDDGLSARLDGITFSKWRNESIKAGGNAIVPQVAYQIFKAISEYEKHY